MGRILKQIGCGVRKILAARLTVAADTQQDVKSTKVGLKAVFGPPSKSSSCAMSESKWPFRDVGYKRLMEALKAVTLKEEAVNKSVLACGK